MKKGLAMLLSAFAMALSADDKISEVELVSDGLKNDTMTVFSSPYDEKDASQEAVDTKFKAFADKYFFGFDIELDNSHPSDTLEIFLKQSRDKSDTRYYQFYGMPAKKDIAPYYYGQINKYYRPLDGNEFNISYLTKKTPEGKENYFIRILLPWSVFKNSLPFEKDDAALWRFNIVRWRDGKGYSWQGKLHQPSTWGVLAMPEFSDDIKEFIYAQTSRNTVFKKPVFDSELYSKESFDKVMPELHEKARNLAKSEPLSLDDARSKFLAVRDIYEMRNDLGASEYSTDNNLNGAKFVFADAPPADGELYLVNASPLKENFSYKLSLDGKILAEGTQKDFPFNFKLPKELIKKDSVLLLESDIDSKRYFKVSFGVAQLKHSLEPAKPYDVRFPAPLEAAPKRDLSGVCETNYLARQIAQQRELVRTNARVVFIGDSITDGFGGAPWARLAKFKPGNMGISGDWTQNVLWRLNPDNYGVLESVRPDVCVLMIGTNNNSYTPQETADGIKAIIDDLKRKLPTVKIVLFGILPRGDVFEKGNRYEQINDIIKNFGDGKNVFYYDMGHLFMDENRKVKRDLLPDGLHPGAKGYDVWVDYITPILEMLTAQEK